MNIPGDLKYTDQYEWAKLDGDMIVMGITDYAQDSLGDLVFVDLPAAGATFTKGSEAIAVESTKAAASVYAAVSGTVAEVNERLADEPGLVNADCYGEGWLIKFTPTDTAELETLMDAAAYEAFLTTLEDE